MGDDGGRSTHCEFCLLSSVHSVPLSIHLSFEHAPTKKSLSCFPEGQAVVCSKLSKPRVKWNEFKLGSQFLFEFGGDSFIGLYPL